jgi:hypothetical protein
VPCPLCCDRRARSGRGIHVRELVSRFAVIAVDPETGNSYLSGFGPGMRPIDRSPEALAAALRTIGKKVGAVAGGLDPAAEYRNDILRRDLPSP